jgi:acetyl esterase/lipase
LNFGLGILDLFRFSNFELVAHLRFPVWHYHPPMPLEFQSIYFDAAMNEGRVLDLFVPEEIRQQTALFFVHGGGWRGGSRAIFHPIIRNLLGRGFVCGSSDYRLKGTNIFDQIMDVRHGYALFLRKQAELGRPGQGGRVVVVGSSAGGHLALLLALAGPGECGEELAFGDMDLRPEEWTVPIGAAVQAAPTRFEPWDEIFPGIWASMQNIVGRAYAEAPDLYRRVAPMTYVRPGSPAVLLMEAGNEYMFPIEYSQEFAAAMHKAGSRAEVIVYPKAEHGFFYDVTRKPQQKALGDLLAFVKSIPG